MKKCIDLWSISKLTQNYGRINFPEYQREPNVWSKDAKQRLVDSISRQFDIAPLYFYTKDDYLFDCVDGRQRIGAIMSFLGQNDKDSHNGFEFSVLNELYEDMQNPYSQLQSLTYSAITQRMKDENNELASNFIRALMGYELTIVKLSDSQEHNEFNLQFARLNLGVIINSGEKLNAMIGDLRNACFDDLGKHPFLEVIRIPERRFAREQTAAQILAQVFNYETNKHLDGTVDYIRTRHFDLQGLFKKYMEMGVTEREWVDKVKSLLDLLGIAKDKFSEIRSRALIVSTILFAYGRGVNTKNDARELAEFINEFVLRLRWQVRKGLDIAQEYRYLADFQKHVTQASVEKPAVTERAKVLEEEFVRWQKTGKLKGDVEYEKSNGEAASDACRREETV